MGEDGSLRQCGKVIAWDRPNGVILAWQLTGEWKFDPDFVTEVQVSFRWDGEVTLVDFEHRNLERYGAVSAALRGEMDGGWAEILAGYERMMTAS